MSECLCYRAVRTHLVHLIIVGQVGSHGHHVVSSPGCCIVGVQLLIVVLTIICLIFDMLSKSDNHPQEMSLFVNFEISVYHCPADSHV